jgi:hypothetical protein
MESPLNQDIAHADEVAPWHLPSEGSDGLGRARVTRATDEPVRARLLLAAAGEAIVEAARKSGIV